MPLGLTGRVVQQRQISGSEASWRFDGPGTVHGSQRAGWLTRIIEAGRVEVPSTVFAVPSVRPNAGEGIKRESEDESDCRVLPRKVPQGPRKEGSKAGHRYLLSEKMSAKPHKTE